MLKTTAPATDRFLRRALCRLPLLLAGVLCALTPALAFSSEWERLDQKAIEAWRQGDYRQAATLEEQAISLAEKNRGPEHLDVANSLNTLAVIYQSQGRYDQAEPLLRRSLAIREKVSGPDNPDLATGLHNLAALYRDQGKDAQAEPLSLRALAIQERTTGANSLEVAKTLNGLAVGSFHMGQYPQAEARYQRALAIREKLLGPVHPEVATSLNNLALLYRTTGRYAQAEQLGLRALAIDEAKLGKDHADLAPDLVNLADTYRAQARYTEAEPLFLRALAIQEKSFGPNHPEIGDTLNNLASLYRRQGQYPKAEALYKRALAMQEARLGPRHPKVGVSLNNLAVLYQERGQYTLAEPLMKRSLLMSETSRGLEHSDVAVSLNNLGDLYRQQGLYAQADPLYRRAMAIFDKTYGPESTQVATMLNNLGAMLGVQKQYAQALPLFERALAIREKAEGPMHPMLATDLSNLGSLLLDMGRLDQAEAPLKRAVAIDEAMLGADNPSQAQKLNNLAGLYLAQKKYTQAEPLYLRALAIREAVFGPNHPEVALTLNNLGFLYCAQGQWGDALKVSRRASTIYRTRIVDGGTGNAAVQEAAENRTGFMLHLDLLSRNPAGDAAESIVDESLQLAQLAQASGTASAIAKMTARFSKGNDALAVLVKNLQDATERVVKDEALLVTAAASQPARRNPANEQRLRDDIARGGQEIAALNEDLAKRFPRFHDLVRPEPLTSKAVQSLLKPGEAMLAYALGDAGSFLWVIKPETTSFVPLPAKANHIAEKVNKVRAEMQADGRGAAQRVRLNLLHELHQSLFVQAAPKLAGVQHILLVPAGALQTLPFGMLVAQPPSGNAATTDYSKVDWLAKHYAFSVLPSVGALQAFRQLSASAPAPNAFAGFGDPLLSEEQGSARDLRQKIAVRGIFRGATRNASGAGSGTGDGGPSEIANADAIRDIARLPETAEELRTMARVLKADPKSIWLQGAATETNVKRLDLSSYRTIAFATHGVMAGELDGIGESGLILTPPAQGSTDDDGYLSASEVAKLKLNADWVILSACNTAAADGTPGAEGLSGLAKAFFYAGARSLLVSHWPVNSAATVPLTTGMLMEYEANQSRGKAQAHRKAILALMASPKFSHPMYWAPFVVVGEGGAGH